MDEAQAAQPIVVDKRATEREAERAQREAQSRRTKHGEKIARGTGPIVPKTLTLSEEAREKLSVAAFRLDAHESVLIDWLVCNSDWTRRYVVQDRTKPASKETTQRETGENPAVETLPIGQSVPPPAPAKAAGGGEKGKRPLAEVAAKVRGRVAG